MRKNNWSRHQFLGFVGSKAEHQTLIAGTLLGGLFAGRFLSIHALRDVGGLGGKVIIDKNGVGVKHVVVVGVADVADGVADDLVDIESLVDRLGLTCFLVLKFGNGDLAADDDHVRLYERLTGDAGGFVDRETSIEDAVGNEVGNLVRMPLAHGLGGENKCVGHKNKTKNEASITDGGKLYINVCACHDMIILTTCPCANLV